MSLFGDMNQRRSDWTASSWDQLAEDLELTDDTGSCEIHELRTGTGQLDKSCASPTSSFPEASVANKPCGKVRPRRSLASRRTVVREQPLTRRSTSLPGTRAWSRSSRWNPARQRSSSQAELGAGAVPAQLETERVDHRRPSSRRSTRARIRRSRGRGTRRLSGERGATGRALHQPHPGQQGAHRRARQSTPTRPPATTLTPPTACRRWASDLGSCRFIWTVVAANMSDLWGCIREQLGSEYAYTCGHWFCVSHKDVWRTDGRLFADKSEGSTDQAGRRWSWPVIRPERHCLHGPLRRARYEHPPHSTARASSCKLDAVGWLDFRVVVNVPTSSLNDSTYSCEEPSSSDLRSYLEEALGL